MVVSLPKPRRRKGSWYVPACEPHYSMDVGPYNTKKEAEQARIGLERTVNTAKWGRVIKECEVEEFDQEWEAMKTSKGNTNGNTR